jgi:DNA polymerase I-like protein with 3'-5' exonuclease and polymerase domains
MTAAIDFESFYSQETNVADMGVWHYARATDIYLVSVAGDNGLRFVGRPQDAPWHELDGQTWVMHNAAFDMTLFEWLRESGQVPSVAPKEVFDTADLSAFLGFPRSLKEASNYLLGLEMSKDVRDKMKGKKWDSMTAEFQEEVKKYALTDAENTLKIWTENGEKWPGVERNVSRMTREMTMRGVPVNITKLAQSRLTLVETSTATRDLLPWHPERPALSLHAVRDYCEKSGIWAPDSFAEKEEQAQKWEEEFSDKFPWVSAIREHRKANKHLKTVETMISRTRPDGRMGYDLKYFGATTGRDSGSGGWNAQNMPRDIVSGVNLRELIEAPEGKTLVICDLAQIEARCILWLARDTDTLDLLRSGIDVYEAHARATMGYNDLRPLKDVDKKLRQLAKARVLGLGFGCGAAKFQFVAKIMAGLEITSSEAETIVANYRASNPKIVALWRALQAALEKSRGTELEVKLPSGRTLLYREVKGEKDGLSGMLPRNGKMMRSKLYGALLSENLTQAFARDVFMDRVLELERQGFETILRIHDEVVCMVDEETSEQSRVKIQQIMSCAPQWCSTLPVGAEAVTSKHYVK